MAERERTRIRDLFWGAGDVIGSSLPPSLALPALVLLVVLFAFVIPFWWIVSELRDTARRGAAK